MDLQGSYLRHFNKLPTGLWYNSSRVSGRGFMQKLLSSRLFQAIRVIPLVACLFFSIWAYPVAAKYPCAKLDETLRIYLSTGYALFLSGELVSDAAIIIMVNTKGTEYVILGVDSEERACILLRGSNLMFFDGSET